MHSLQQFTIKNSKSETERERERTLRRLQSFAWAETDTNAHRRVARISICAQLYSETEFNRSQLTAVQSKDCFNFHLAKVQPRSQHSEFMWIWCWFQRAMRSSMHAYCAHWNAVIDSGTHFPLQINWSYHLV